MGGVESRPLESDGSSITMGVLALLAAALSVTIYAMDGEWPARLGGLEVVFFLLIAIGLFGYNWVKSR